MKGHEELIADVPLLARLPEAERRALASRGVVRTYPDGALIFQEGGPGDSLHIVMEGAIRIALLSPSGEEATVAVLGPGEFVGHLALLDGRPRSASAIASGETRTLVVWREDFLRWLSEHPASTLALLETLSLLLRHTDEVLADLAFLGLAQRLAKRLVDLVTADQAQAESPDESLVLSMTQRELASMLGVSRESVNKQLNVLARKGWVSLGRGTVTVLNVDALRMFP